MPQNLGWLVGLGRAVGAERERQTALTEEQQRLERDNQRQSTERYSRFLEKLLDSDALPDTAREPVLTNLMTIVSTPGGMKQKDLEKTHQSLLDVINSPRPVMGDEEAIGQLRQPTVDALTATAGMPDGMDFSGQASMVPSRARTTRGLVTRSERANYDRSQALVQQQNALNFERQKAAIGAQYRPDRYQVVKGDDGMYSFENGRFVSRTPFEQQPTASTIPTIDKPKTGWALRYNLKVSQWQRSHPGQQPDEGTLLQLQQSAIEEAAHADDYGWQRVGPTNPGVIIIQTPNGPVPVGANMDRTGQPISVRGDTFFTPDGTAVTAGVSNISRNAPPNVSAGVQGDIAAMQTLKKETDIIERIAPNGKVGPIAGRIANVQMKYLGGMALSPQEKEVAIWLQEMFATKGFDEGGKQLTGPEREIFAGILPSSADTVETIMTKLAVARQRLDIKLQSILTSMPQRQSAQLTNVPGQQSIIPQRQSQVVAPVPGITAGSAPAPAPASASTGTRSFKPGDVVTYKGKKIRIKAVSGTKITDYDEVP